MGSDRSPSRDSKKLALFGTLAAMLLLAAGVYVLSGRSAVHSLKGQAHSQVSKGMGRRDAKSVGGADVSTGSVSGRADLVKVEAVYERNLKRREEAYGKQLDGQFLSKGNVFQYFQATYPCVAEERVGSWKDGGKWLCDVSSLGPESVVYSIGSYELVDFEEALYDVSSGAEIHVFDHTLKEDQQKRMRANKKLKYHNIGLGGETKEGRLVPLISIMETLKHSFIDVLKIDCEGCEFSVFPAIFKAFEGKKPPFGQIQLEVHEYHSNWDNVRDLLTLIESRGYRMLHYDVNWECDQCMEVALIHESLVRPDQVSR